MTVDVGPVPKEMSWEVSLVDPGGLDERTDPGLPDAGRRILRTLLERTARDVVGVAR
ncbi:hypothetical protein AB0I68_38335 [Streptomyces sp. NPDC050448]|uniref:hypothetical protein n=1 Tax=Streptomyces sp. NPDC050448 TaxID=3155404 RepID=UPI003429F6AA